MAIRYLNQPVAQATAKKWLTITGGQFGVYSLLTLISFPEKVADLIDEQTIEGRYFAIALVATILGGLPLLLTRKLFALSIAQNLAYLGYLCVGFGIALFTLQHAGFDLQEVRLVLTGILLLVTGVFLFSLWQGLQFFLDNNAWLDFIVSIFGILLLIPAWCLPFYELWSL